VEDEVILSERLEGGEEAVLLGAALVRLQALGAVAQPEAGVARRGAPDGADVPPPGSEAAVAVLALDPALAQHPEVAAALRVSTAVGLRLVGRGDLPGVRPSGVVVVVDDPEAHALNLTPAIPPHQAAQPGRWPRPVRHASVMARPVADPRAYNRRTESADDV